MTVAVRGYINDEGDVELRSSVHNSLRILRHTVVEVADSLVIVEDDCIEVTCTETSSAADAVALVNCHLALLLVKYKTSVSAFLLALSAGSAEGLVDMRLSA